MIDWIGDYDFEVVTDKYLQSHTINKMSKEGFLLVKEVYSGIEDKQVFIFARPKKRYG